MSKNILFLVESYGSGARANGICTKKIIDEITNMKHSVVVLTSKTQFRQPYKEIEENKVIYRFNRDFGFLFLNISKYKKGYLGAFFNFLSKVYSILCFPILLFYWPFRSIVLLFKYYITAIIEHKRNKFDTVVGVNLYLEEVIAATLLKIKYPNIKLIVYTLDALSGKEFPKKYTLAQKNIVKWEKYIFKYTDVICVLESHKEHYVQEKYNEIRHKIEYVDIPLFKPRKVLTPLISNQNDTISIVYTGSTTFISGDPGYFLEILKSLENVTFHLYGVTDSYVKKQIDDSGLLGKKIITHGKVEHSEITRIHDNADLLISFGSRNGNMIPSKIFEYISSRKPIINLYKIENDPAYPYIEKYPDKIQIHEKTSELETNIRLLKRFIFNTQRVNISNEYLLNTYKENTPFPMIKQILKE